MPDSSKWHCAQIKAGAAPCVVGQFGKGVGQTARAHIVDGQDGRYRRPRRPALVDHLLGTALDLGVAALHGVKVQIGRVVAATGHGAGGTAAHANAHAGPTQLDQQAARGKFNLVGLTCRRITPKPPGNHDGLVVAALHAMRPLCSYSRKVAQQIGAAELVVEGGATQGAFGHDGQARWPCAQACRQSASPTAWKR
jgi:hypothetical protein